MKIIQQLLDVLAPTMALKRRTRKDAWVRNMVIAMQWKLFDPEEAKKDDSARMIQSFDSSVRDQMAEYFLGKITCVADSKNRLLACRKWLVDEARTYAPLKAVFTAQSSYDLEIIARLRHPCNIGLWECIGEVVEKTFVKELRQYGSIDAVVNKLREESVWRNIRTNFANLGRIALDDDEPWFPTYMNYLVAEAEIEIRASLGWEMPCSLNTLKAEISTFEKHILEGKPNPFESIKISYS